MEGPDERMDIPTAAARHGRPARAICHLIRTGQLSSEKVRVLGSDGRHVRKHMIRREGLDAAFSTEEADRYDTEVKVAAPPLSEKQKAIIAAVFNSRHRH